jgi:hypothetical protein
MRRLLPVLALLIGATTARAQEAPAEEATTATTQVAATEDAATDATVDAPVEEGRPTEKGTLGLGIIIGEPTGITAKLYLADDQAIQVAIGGSFIADAWQLHGEYVLHPWILQDRDTFVLPVYVGPGLRFMRYNEGRASDDAHYAVGLRAVIGLLFDFKNVPLDVFVEIGGVLEYDFSDGAGIGGNIGAGIRYYF